MWTNDQRKRFILENEWLKHQEMDQFCVYYKESDDTYYAKGTATSNSGRRYGLYVILPTGYPNSRPSMYLTDPIPLLAYDGSRVTSAGVSHNMHTLAPSPQGHVQLCHWRDNRWHGQILLYKVFLKGLLWIEAYEQHLSTGRSIADFVLTMKETA
jgi:hypothetical protein